LRAVCLNASQCVCSRGSAPDPLGSRPRPSSWIGEKELREGRVRRAKGGEGKRWEGVEDQTPSKNSSYQTWCEGFDVGGVSILGVA